MKDAAIFACLFAPILVFAASSPGPSRIQMHNVDFRMDESLVLQIGYLDGKLLPAPGADLSAVFDNPRSFILEIDDAEIALSTAGLAHLLNTHVFPGKDSPLRDLEVSTKAGKIRLKGKLHKGVALPFDIVGELEATTDGKIRVRPAKIHALKIPVKGLMDVFGIDTADLIAGQSGRGITVQKDDIILDPERMLPPPQIKGRVTKVHLEGDRVVQVFGSGRKRLEYPNSNYIAHHGGTLRFGKLTMDHADLALIDQDPRDPFEFYLAQYHAQLVAGYSKTQPDAGLKTYLPDYGDLIRKPARAGAAAR